MRLPLPQFLSLLVHSFTLIHSQREMVNDGGDCKPGLEIWICNGNLKPQQWKETRKKCLSVVHSIVLEQEPVITSVAITTAARLTSSYLQHHYGTSHTSTAMWDYTYSRYDETCTTTCVPAESSPPRWQRGRPRQGGGGQGNWKQIEGKWCLASSYALIAFTFIFFFPRFLHAREPALDRKLLCCWRRPSTLRHWHLRWTLLWKSRCFYSCEKIVQSGQLQWFEALTHCVSGLIAAHGNRTAQISPWYRREKILTTPKF